MSKDVLKSFEMHMLKQLCASLILGAHAFFDCIHYAAYVFLQLAVKKNVIGSYVPRLVKLNILIVLELIHME